MRVSPVLGRASAAISPAGRVARLWPVSLFLSTGGRLDTDADASEILEWTSKQRRRRQRKAIQVRLGDHAQILDETKKSLGPSKVAIKKRMQYVVVATGLI
jgi:hypothetical protein